jgi:hypothetical protein
MDLSDIFISPIPLLTDCKPHVSGSFPTLYYRSRCRSACGGSAGSGSVLAGNGVPHTNGTCSVPVLVDQAVPVLGSLVVVTVVVEIPFSTSFFARRIGHHTGYLSKSLQSKRLGSIGADVMVLVPVTTVL